MKLSLLHIFDQPLDPVAHVGHDHLGPVAAFIGIRLHADEVDVAFDLVVLHIGHHQRADGRPELGLQLLQDLIEIRAESL